MGYAFQRFGQMMVIVLIALLAVFTTQRLAPGGPFDGERPPPPKILKNLRAYYDMDLSMPAQFYSYLFGMAGRAIEPGGSPGEAYWIALPPEAEVTTLGGTQERSDDGVLFVRQFCPWGQWFGRMFGAKTDAEGRPLPTLRKCGIIRGDFGLSMVRRSIYVNDYVRDGLPATLKYAVPSLLFALLLGIPMGFYAAYRQNKPADFVMVTVGMFGTIVPNLVMAPLLVFLLAFQFDGFLHWLLVEKLEWIELGRRQRTLNWIPAGKTGGVMHYVLPTLVLGTGLLGRIVRLSRAGALEPCVRTTCARPCQGPAGACHPVPARAQARDPSCRDLYGAGHRRDHDRLADHRAGVLAARSGASVYHRCNRPRLHAADGDDRDPAARGDPAELHRRPRLLVARPAHPARWRRAQLMSLLNRTNNQAALEAAVTTLQSRSLTQLAIARFLRNRVAVGASIVLLILVALAVFAPVFELLTGYPMEFQDRDFYSGKPPNWEAQHYLGTDYNGRDILVRTMFGMRISMMVALVAATVALVIGISYGAISGLAGGLVDTIMMRILDLLYSFPLTLIAVIALAYFGRNIMIVFVIIGLVEWQLMARVIRGQVLSLRNAEFIEAARATGSDPLASSSATSSPMSPAWPSST